jgi:hypothetical protein
MAEIILRYGGNYLKGSDLLFMPLLFRPTPGNISCRRLDKRS